MVEGFGGICGTRLEIVSYGADRYSPTNIVPPTISKAQLRYRTRQSGVNVHKYIYHITLAYVFHGDNLSMKTRTEHFARTP